MTDAHWSRLTDLVPEALALPAAERDAFLDAACTAPDGTPDAALRREAAALVAAADAADAADAFASPLAGLAADAAEVERLGTGALPERLGPWRVTGLLGEGGMGVVYRAERADGLFEREVALKRIRPGLARALAGRLDAERQVLARLEHDGIARLYDGGVADDGTPYVVMELVEGRPITEHADAAALDAEARVRLFAEVCDAVAYAHRHLVVHRDLKPSNVFVTDGAAGTPSVKLLDFGIAKLLGDAAVGPLVETLTRTQAAMTPSYAAPEQLARGEVTTATDVYALGVMLYELLAGRRPYSLADASPAEAERIVCETEPPPPSAVAPAERARALRGDLDTIVAKALAKEPGRRYPSAEALAADLRRHLDGLPVEARPATAAYRTRRFVRRHRAGVAAAALVVLALVAGAGVALWQARAARAESAKATAMNEFLVGLLGAADPTADGRDVRVASLLDRAAGDLDSVFADQPDVEGAMRHTLGTTYTTLGLLPEADRELRRALALRERLHAPGHPDVVETQEALAYALLLQDDLAGADSLLTVALAAARDVLADDDPLVGTVLSSLGYVRFLDGDLDASLALHKEAVAVSEAQPEPDPIEIASGLGNVAVVLGNMGRPAEAAEIQERQVEVYRGAFAPDNPRIARALDNLGGTYYELGRLDDALHVSTEAVGIYRRALGPGSADLGLALSNAAPILLALGRPADSEAALREALEHYEASVGAGHPRYGSALVKLGQAIAAQRGRTVEAEATLRRAVALFREAMPPTHPAIGHSTFALGELLAEAGRAGEAVLLLREAVAVRREALPPDHPDLAVATSVLGDALRQTGQTAEAEPLLTESHATLARAAAGDASLAALAAEAAGRLAALYDAQGRRADAARLRAASGARPPS